MLNLSALVGLVGLFGIAIYAWSTLPDTIPVHFGFDGQANGWGSKKVLWLLPIIGLAGLLSSTNSRFQLKFNICTLFKGNFSTRARQNKSSRSCTPC
ncbi:MAG: DUF1648 domain-containing protein [Nostoc sp.]